MNYRVNVWIERDRHQISLETEDGDEVFSLTDEDFDDAIESGYLVPPRHPRPTETMWLTPAIEYATSMKLLP